MKGGVKWLLDGMVVVEKSVTQGAVVAVVAGESVIECKEI
ncbi:hypothetical protein [Dipodfec virus UOA04_Rod_985]|nr:hypothetical protein [Dipodfec virus UOA04_Rod_985]